MHLILCVAITHTGWFSYPRSSDRNPFLPVLYHIRGAEEETREYKMRRNKWELVLECDEVTRARLSSKKRIRRQILNDIKEFSNDLAAVEAVRTVPNAGQIANVLGAITIAMVEVESLLEAYTRQKNKPIQDAIYIKYAFHITYEFAKSRTGLFNRLFWQQLGSCGKTNVVTLRTELHHLNRLCDGFMTEYKTARDNSTGHRTISARAMSTYNLFFRFPFVLERICKFLSQLARVRRLVAQAILAQDFHPLSGFDKVTN
jgi:hypothetical protein